MKPENIATLEKHRHFHTTLINAFYIKGLNHMEKDDMLRIMREEFNPMASPDLWCPKCIADFVKDLYNRFDNYLASVKQPVLEPTSKEAINVKANFPKHKRR